MICPIFTSGSVLSCSSGLLLVFITHGLYDPFELCRVVFLFRQPSRLSVRAALQVCRPDHGRKGILSPQHVQHYCGLWFTL